MNYDRLGLLGFAVLVLAIVGTFQFLARTAAERHRDNPVAQTVIKFF